jgi:RNA polymerase sigma-70 factor (ECF subfamily)
MDSRPHGPAEESGLEEERQLVARSQTGDQAAFRALVDAHRDRAYGLALRIVRSPADAEEVAQDAFVRAWLALPRYRGEARFSTWMYRIVARRALDRVEVLRGRWRREAGIEGVESLPDSAATGEEAERASLGFEMERMLEELSDVQRTVVTLFYYEDQSVEQVASTLEMPEGTVKTHLSRARASLRTAWLRRHGREGA